MRQGHPFDRSRDYGIASLGLALTLGGLAAGLLLGNGWHAGFMNIQAASALLPSWFWESCTTLGDARLLLALALPLLCREPRLLWAILLAALVGGLLSRGIKLAFAMPRPAAILDLGQMTVIGARLTRHSFVSGHTVTAFAFFSVWLGVLGWRRSWLIFVLASLAGMSRVAVGAHWPIDVLAGAMLGLLAGWLGCKLAGKLQWGSRPGNQGILLGLVVIAVATLPLDGQGYPGSLLWRTVACLWGLFGVYLSLRQAFLPWPGLDVCGCRRPAPSEASGRACPINIFVTVPTYKPQVSRYSHPRTLRKEF